MPRLSDLTRFIDERTGLITSLRGYRDVPYPHRRAWEYGFGPALAALVGLVCLSGLGLALFYSPSTTAAWASIEYLEHEVRLGALIRALHYQGTNILLVTLALHLLHVVLTAGYRAPREATWWFGLALVALVLGTCMTGALLPWDDQGYWASQVEIGIMGTVPIIGQWIQQIALGGNSLGNLSLTRYYALHAIVFPGLLIGTIAMHVALIRKHGVSIETESQPHERKPWWPTQAVRDGGMALLLLGITFAAAIKYGAPLEAPADPSGNYPARPVWYFRGLFELRRHFEGPLEPIATMLIPGIAGAFFAALPFLDRAGSIRKRAPYLVGVIGCMVAVLALTSMSLHRDAKDKNYQAQRADAAVRYERALVAAKDGVPPEGALFMLHNTPEFLGQKLFFERCSGCHLVGGKGTDKPKGPDLAGYLNREWLAGVVARPAAPEFFGRTKCSGMDSFEKLGPPTLATLAAFLHALQNYPDTPAKKLPPSMKAGYDEYSSQGCEGCHSLTPGEANGASNLSGYGSEKWLIGLMLTPGGETYFGDDNDMPSYQGKLSDKDMKNIVTYLRLLEDKQVQYQSAVASTRP